MLGSLIGPDAALQLTLHRLVDDDAVVDQHADAHGQPEQGDQVERLAGDEQQRQRGQQACRHRDRDDRHRAPLAQEQVQHDQRDQETGERQPLQTVELILDLPRPVEVDDEVDAVGAELLAQRFEAVAQGVPQLDQVGLGILVNQQPHGRAAVDAEHRFPAARPESHVGHVAQQGR